MRKVVFVSWMIFVCFLISGCVVAIGNKGEKSPAHCIKDPQTRSIIAEIDAVSKIMSDTAKKNVYLAIANRPGLSPAARSHLTKEAMKNLMSDSAKEAVLLTLAKNITPAPTPKPTAQEDANCPDCP